MTNPTQDALRKRLSEEEKLAVRMVGERIGHGRVMQLAQECWRDALVNDGLPPGGEFAYGPCVGLTVPCGCQAGCDWCEGSRWLTRKVKALKDAETKAK